MWNGLNGELCDSYVKWQLHCAVKKCSVMCCPHYLRNSIYSIGQKWWHSPFAFFCWLRVSDGIYSRCLIAPAGHFLVVCCIVFHCLLMDFPSLLLVAFHCPIWNLPPLDPSVYINLLPPLPRATVWPQVELLCCCASCVCPSTRFLNPLSLLSLFQGFGTADFPNRNSCIFHNFHCKRGKFAC